MNSTLNPKLSDDPHDFVVVPPDAVRVAPSDEEELSSLLHQAARHRSDPQGRADSDQPAGPTVPPVDTTFRPTAANDAQNDLNLPGNRRSTGSRVLRPLIALLLAGCIGLVAVGWRSHGDTVKRQFASWTTQAGVTLSLSPEEPASAEAQAVALAAAAEAANAAPPQPEAPVQNAAEATAPAAADPSADSAQLLRSMARDLSNLGQEVAQLKASLAQLKASQQQASRDAAKASEPKAAAAKPSEQRPRISVTSPPPPRPAEARPRQPPSYPPAQAAAPQAPAPYYASRQPDYYAQRQPDYAPRQIAPQPQFTAEPQADPEMSPIPRPPMPVR